MYVYYNSIKEIVKEYEMVKVEVKKKLAQYHIHKYK